MKRNFHKSLIASLLIILSLSCKHSYEPSVTKTNRNYLVVDGFINSGGDTTTITLSRTARIFDTVIRKPETNAQVKIAGENGETFPLSEQANGKYSVDHLNLDSSIKYRLEIITSQGNKYLSDFVPVKITPAIDSVTWQTDSLGVSIYVNAHDPLNDTKYYRWDYEETWGYHSNQDTQFDWANGQLIIRNPSDKVYYCYRSSSSTDLLLGTTAKLNQDIVFHSRVASITKGSEKLSDLYSILVKQYALPKETYEYLQNLKKTTEQTGSIFDSQPTELTGNIHCVTNPGEIVLGFVSASNIATKRIFINNHNFQFPDWGYQYYWLALLCETKIFTTEQMNLYFSGPGPYAYVVMGSPPMSPPGFYIVSSSNCTDCRTHGGTIIKPPYWP